MFISWVCVWIQNRPYLKPLPLKRFCNRNWHPLVVGPILHNPGCSNAFVGENLGSLRTWFLDIAFLRWLCVFRSMSLFISLFQNWLVVSDGFSGFTHCFVFPSKMGCLCMHHAKSCLYFFSERQDKLWYFSNNHNRGSPPAMTRPWISLMWPSTGKRTPSPQGSESG